MPRYNFGVYHWRRRFRRLGGSILAVLLGFLLVQQNSRIRRLCGILLVAAGVRRGSDPLRRILDPPPWALESDKYHRLAEGLPFDRADNVLDVGSGTGRSLVGIAPFLQPDTELVALDVFDSRVILGNAAGLTRANARAAGVDGNVLQGDASQLPIRSDSQDVVTLSRILHDLPDEDTADAALSEARRVISPDGRLGVLEVPVTPGEGGENGLAWWEKRVRRADFRILEATSVDGYVLIRAAPQ
jgi:SAM-dependent methyltransferase